MQDDLQAVFADGGLLATQIEGFQPREAQQQMADKVGQTLQNGTILVAEAGTGTGKTFAYLAPAILSGQKVFISTGTKNLQDQLFKRDLPMLRKALGVPFQASVLKGRSNYLCLHRLKLAPHLGYINRETRSALSEINEWSKSTQSGDISELTSIAEDSYVWPMVTSTVENCLGGECDHWDSCFIARARKQLMLALD